jgi:hypothetical protein
MRFLVWALLAGLIHQQALGGAPAAENQGEVQPPAQCVNLRLERSLALEGILDIPLNTAELIADPDQPHGLEWRRTLGFRRDYRQTIYGTPDTRSLRALLREAYLAKFFSDQRSYDLRADRARIRYRSLYFADSRVASEKDGYQLVYGNPQMGQKASTRMCVDMIAHDPVRNTYSLGEAKGRDILHAVHQIFATISAVRFNHTRWIRGLHQIDDVAIVTCEHEALPRYFSVNESGNLMTLYYNKWVEVRVFQDSTGEYGIYPPQLHPGFPMHETPPFAIPPAASRLSRPVKMIFTHGDAEETHSFLWTPNLLLIPA